MDTTVRLVNQHLVHLKGHLKEKIYIYQEIKKKGNLTMEYQLV